MYLKNKKTKPQMKLKNIGTISLTTLLLFTSISSNASCEKPVTYLGQGSTSPCSGFLFSPEKELDVRIQVEQKKKFEELVKIQEERLDLYQKMNKELNNELYKRDKYSRLENGVYFIVGALLTGFIAVNVR